MSDFTDDLYEPDDYKPMSETKQGYVQLKERTKSNKAWKLKIDGKYISVSNRANMDGVEQGTYVQYELGGFQGDNGWIATIERIKPIAAPVGPAKPQGGMFGGSPVSKLASAFWDDSALRFISNVVGCAIEAQTCPSPEHVVAWTLAAESALKALGQAQASGSRGPSRDSSGSASRDSVDDYPFDDSESLERLMPRGGDKEPNW